MSEQTEELDIMTGGDANAPDHMQDAALAQFCAQLNKDGGWLFKQYLEFNPSVRQHKVIVTRPAALLVTRAGHPLRS